MNILVIGNGFDLAHGLDTRYTDFIEFVRKDKFDCLNDKCNEFDDLVKNNI